MKEFWNIIPISLHITTIRSLLAIPTATHSITSCIANFSNQLIHMLVNNSELYTYIANSVNFYT